MRFVFTLLICSAAFVSTAQFSPDGGQQGSIAIHKDSVEWKGFASEVYLELGWLDVADTSLGRIDVVVRDGAIGAPDFDAQPLGDAGQATVTFDQPFADQAGYDFVVFENGFATSDTTGFFELAFVEVSSNGLDFFRFPCTSLSLPEVFAGPFAELDSRLIDGLAGRFSAPYGAPFDLADLPIDPLLDLSAIRFIRVIDVIGTADPSFASIDSDGEAIIDPYPTAFMTGGFDLDAVGILADGQISQVLEVTAFAKTPKTTAVLKGELIESLNPSALWLNTLGKVCHTGQFAPLLEGSYFVLEHQNNADLRRIFVY